MESALLYLVENDYFQYLELLELLEYLPKIHYAIEVTNSLLICGAVILLLYFAYKFFDMFF